MQAVLLILALIILIIIGGFILMSLFDILSPKRKEGDMIISGRGECFISADFHAHKADVHFYKHPHHCHASCEHRNHNDLVEIEIVSASKRKSKVKITWDVSHQTTVTFTIRG